MNTRTAGHEVTERTNENTEKERRKREEEDKEGKEGIKKKGVRERKKQTGERKIWKVSTPIIY